MESHAKALSFWIAPFLCVLAPLRERIFLGEGRLLRRFLRFRDSSGAAMKLNLTSLEVTKDKGVMFIIRGKGMDENKDNISAIINSVAAEK